jgi:hypothetical protein
MRETEESPKITGLAWGRVEVEGLGAFKDVKLYPGGGRAWDWGETGTGHDPGIQMADVEELLEHGAQVVVLTQGVLGQLKVMPETVMDLKARGITVHVLKTKQAVKKYNQLLEDQPVGILLHSTC